ncbi:MAG: hypothetical protein KDB23_26565, partial [Planctomycetales bacterium]|nr:hypothetical protein [Planctomycetales bacterium]
TANTYWDRPDVFEHAVDMADVLTNPQVLYISLKSAVDPINSANIARIILWTLFNSGAHSPQGKYRAYLFVDEFQRIISEGIALPFEQFRDLGGTIIAAHQTLGQLKRSGADLTETVDSCTAVKQVFRASSLISLERMEKLSGKTLRPDESWAQPQNPLMGDLLDMRSPHLSSDGEAKLRWQEGPRLSQDDLMRISSNRLESLVRFTFGSGYTQFAGRTVPMRTDYPIRWTDYVRRRAAAWPKVPGAFVNEVPESRNSEISVP